MTKENAVVLFHQKTVRRYWYEEQNLRDNMSNLELVLNMHPIAEKDWKRLRAKQEEKLDQVCETIINS